MKKWHFIIDVAKCEDCNNCFLSCKDEHVGNDWPKYTLSQPLHGHRWMNIMRKERGQFPMVDVAYLPVPCMHCDSAPCVKAAKNGAVYKRDDGIVMIDPEKARGREDIVKACPYGVVWWNEEEHVPQKCTFCAHLLDEGWEQPRCVQACPTGALKAVKEEDSEIQKMIVSDSLQVFHPEYRTNPRVYYKNLYRYSHCFIGGSVAFERDGIVDCAEGAVVTLMKDSKGINETETDNYGDFKFDGLAENNGEYTIEIHFRDYGKKAMDVHLKTSLNIGTVIFSKN